MLLPVIPAKIFLVHNFFFFNDTATTEIYTLSLHDALPISITLAWSVVGTEPIPRARAASMRFWQAGMTELAPPGGTASARTTEGASFISSASPAAERELLASGGTCSSVLQRPSAQRLPHHSSV